MMRIRKRQKSHRLEAAVLPTNRLGAADRLRIFQLMQQSYDGITKQRFFADLEKKDRIILLRDRKDGTIRGFSTLVVVKALVNGRNLRGVFSGDTVIEQAYWGQRALGKAFLGFMCKEKLRRPFSPLYWLLISKGYKTYLMMANNFTEHYPRYEKFTPPEVQAKLDAFYTTLFPQDYDPQTGLIRFREQVCRLKNGIAGISPELRQSNRRVAFYHRSNPDWSQGVELACLARMSLMMPIAYALKVAWTDRCLPWLGRLWRNSWDVPAKERPRS